MNYSRTALYILLLGLLGTGAPKGCSEMTKGEDEELKEYCGKTENPTHDITHNYWVVSAAYRTSCWEHFKAATTEDDGTVTAAGPGHSGLSLRECSVIKVDEEVTIACLRQLHGLQ